MSRVASLREAIGRNTVHPFPARMAAGLAMHALSELRRSVTVLDPMVGSGTVLAVARANGHRCIGFDVDPLAVLISRVWTRTIDVRQVQLQADRVLADAKKKFSDLNSGDAYPQGADQETREFVRYWFDAYARRQLAALARVISRVESKSAQEVLWCAFSRLIITKQSGASLALDLAHSRPHRSFERSPRKPFRQFPMAVERVLSGCMQRGERDAGPRATVSLGDARAIPLADKSVDLVFTSPPYLNAIDYIRCSKFSLVWMGYSVAELRAIRGSSIGAENRGTRDVAIDTVIDRLRLSPDLAPRMRGILRRYIEDTNRALKEVARVLSARGKAVYVLGENTIRGTFVPTSRLVTRLAADAGLQLINRRYRALPSNKRYLPPPGNGRTPLDSRIRREVILTFEQR